MVEEEGVGRLSEPEEQGVCCKIVSPSNVRSYTQKLSLTPLPKRVLKKYNNNRHAEVDRESP